MTARSALALVAAWAFLVTSLASEIVAAGRFGAGFRLTTPLPATVPIAPQRPGRTRLYHSARVEAVERWDTVEALAVEARLEDPGFVAWRILDGSGGGIEARHLLDAAGPALVALRREPSGRADAIARAAGSTTRSRVRLGLTRTGSTCRMQAGETALEVPCGDLVPPLRVVLATGSGRVDVRRLEVTGQRGGRTIAERAGATGWGRAALATMLLVATLGALRAALAAGAAAPGRSLRRASVLALLAGLAAWGPLLPVLLPVVLGGLSAAFAAGAAALTLARSFVWRGALPSAIALFLVGGGAAAARAAVLGDPVEIAFPAAGEAVVAVELDRDTVAELTLVEDRADPFPGRGWPAVVLSSRADLGTCLAWADRGSIRCYGKPTAAAPPGAPLRLSIGHAAARVVVDLGSTRLATLRARRPQVLHLKVIAGGAARAMLVEPVAGQRSAGMDTRLPARTLAGVAALAALGGAAVMLLVGRLPRSVLRVAVLRPLVVGGLAAAASTWLVQGAWLAALAALAFPVAVSACLHAGGPGRARTGAFLLVGLIAGAPIALGEPSAPLVERRSVATHPLRWYVTWLRSIGGDLVTDGLFRGRRYRAEERECILIVALGSSSTWGAAVAAEEAYPARLEELLARTSAGPCHRVLNGAKSGTWSTGVLEAFDGIYAPLRPAVVTVSLGNNDRIAGLAFEDPGRRYATARSFASRWWVPALADPTSYAWVTRDPDGARARRLERNLVALGEAARRAGARLVPIVEPTAVAFESGADPHAAFGDAVRAAARTLGVSAVEPGDALREVHTYEDVFLDDVHLTAHGHALVAEALAPLVRAQVALALR